MQGNTVMAKASSENGKTTITISKEYVVESASDVLLLTIKEGALAQRGLASKISSDLKELGFECSESESQFSQMINDKTHPLFKHIEMIASIAKHQKLGWLAEYFATISGGKFQPFTPHERSNQVE